MLCFVIIYIDISVNFLEGDRETSCFLDLWTILKSIKLREGTSLGINVGSRTITAIVAYSRILYEYVDGLYHIQP